MGDIMIHIFIVNPYAGNKTFADDLRRQLAEIKDLRYFVFNTRYAGFEKELVGWICDIFQGEKLRFYCCGGSGTTRNMLCGFESLDDVEVAIYPCGLSNDFLKVFGNQAERFHDLNELINGDVIDVDYIDTNKGRALNTFSLGVDTISQRVIEDIRILNNISNQLPYITSILYAILASKAQEYIINVDGKDYSGMWSEIFFGNGGVLGGNCHFTENPYVNDGKGEMVLLYCKNPSIFMKRLTELTSAAYDKVAENTTQDKWEEISIRRKDGKPFTMNFDGELVDNVEEWHARMVHKGLHLVVPKGVSI